MKKTTFMRNLNRRTRRIVIASAAGLAAAGILTFALVFRVTAVEIVGNTRFQDKEIRDMALTGPFSWNTILIEKFHNHVDSEEPLIESIDLERIGNNKILIRVNEKQLIGYVQYQGRDWYFDADGIVLEDVESSAAPGNTDASADNVPESTDPAAAGGSTEGTEAAGGIASPGDIADVGGGASSDKEEADGGEDVLAPQSIDADAADGTDTQEDDEEPTAQFNPALTNVPLITGLSFSSVANGEQLPVDNPKVFNTIHGIARMVDKYEIVPDSVEFDADYNITLHYGNVRIQLGQDENLEEKLIRAAAILPSIRSYSGVLHMEDFTNSTENIIFEKDLTPEQQQAQDEAAQQRIEELAEENEENAGADDETENGEDSGSDTQDNGEENGGEDSGE